MQTSQAQDSDYSSGLIFRIVLITLFNDFILQSLTHLTEKPFFLFSSDCDTFSIRDGLQ